MPPPELLDDLVEEVLLRVPPDDPALLVRASLVCKLWRRLLTDAAFLLRYRAFHRTPPLLGFVHHQEPCESNVQFVPAASFCPANPDRGARHVLDCRHGLVLLCNRSGMSSDFIVWDPITYEEWHVPQGIRILYERFDDFAKAAVLCAVPDCDHGDCHGGPFLLVLVDVVGVYHDDSTFPRARVFSSETGDCSTPAISS